MKIVETEIPTTFVALDTRVNAADSFANVRDIQQMRKNHNALLARRVRRNIYTQVFNNNGSPAKWRSLWNENPQLRDTAFVGRIAVTQGTKTLTLKLRAALEVAGTNIAVYATLSRLDAHQPLDLSNTVDVTSTTEAAYSLTVPVPIATGAGLQHGQQFYNFAVLVASEFDSGTLIDNAEAITGFSEGWFTASAFGAAVGDAVRFSDGNIGIKRVRSILNYGTDKRINLQPAFTRMPSTSTTYDSAKLLGINVTSISLYENVVTDFSATPGFL